MIDLPWPAHIENAILTFIICLFLFHAIFVYPILTRFGLQPLDDIAWKRVDYIWVGLASLSIVSGAAEARKVMSGVLYDQTTARYIADVNYVRRETQRWRDVYCNAQRVRSELSPSNFDELVRQEKMACQWFQEALDYLKKRDTQFEKGDFSISLPTYKVQDPYSLQGIHRVEDLVKEFVDFKNYQKSLAAAKDRTELELILLVFSPVMFAAAVALRLTKVTGEVRIAKLKSITTSRVSAASSEASGSGNAAPDTTTAAP